MTTRRRLQTRHFPIGSLDPIEHNRMRRMDREFRDMAKSGLANPIVTLDTLRRTFERFAETFPASFGTLYTQPLHLTKRGKE